MRLRGISGNIYDTDYSPFTSGGEGAIYRVISNPGVVVKVYTPAFATPERFEKLKLMKDHQPVNDLYQLAWPIDVLLFEDDTFAGFAMPTLKSDKILADIYIYTNDLYSFKTIQKIYLGINICDVIDTVHKTGCVFGDFNPGNIGVNTVDGNVAFFDVDSFHVDNRRGNGKIYPTVACFPGYAAPEVLRTCRKVERDTRNSNNIYLRAASYVDEKGKVLGTFNKYTDYFALSIHIFSLLFNGVNPYRGVSNARGASSKVIATGDIAVENDQYCFKDNYSRNLLIPPINAVPKEIGTLFTRAFIEGKDYPDRRPRPSEWRNALERYGDNLFQCINNSSHQYMRGLPNCVWCEANERFDKNIPWPNKWPKTQRNGLNKFRNIFKGINEL